MKKIIDDTCNICELCKEEKETYYVCLEFEGKWYKNVCEECLNELDLENN